MLCGFRAGTAAPPTSRRFRIDSRMSDATAPAVLLRDVRLDRGGRGLHGGDRLRLAAAHHHGGRAADHHDGADGGQDHPGLHRLVACFRRAGVAGHEDAVVGSGGAGLRRGVGHRHDRSSITLINQPSASPARSSPSRKTLKKHRCGTDWGEIRAKLARQVRVPPQFAVGLWISPTSPEQMGHAFLANRSTVGGSRAPRG